MREKGPPVAPQPTGRRPHFRALVLSPYLQLSAFAENYYYTENLKASISRQGGIGRRDLCWTPSSAAVRRSSKPAQSACKALTRGSGTRSTHSTIASKPSLKT